MRTRALSLLAGTAALSIAALAIASPASAATLPPGQKITIVDAPYGEATGTGPFYNVNPADAAITPVGTGSDADISAIDVNDKGLGYAIGYTDVPTLWKADANTGTVSDPLPLFFAQSDDFQEGTVPQFCDAIDLNPNGQLLVACSYNTGFNAGTVSSVDVTTGRMTLLTYMVADFYQVLDAIALDPTTGILWGFGDFSAGGGTAAMQIPLNADNPYWAPQATSFLERPVLGADFDRSGQLFVSTFIEDADFRAPALGVVDPSTGEFSFAEWYHDSATDKYTGSVGAITVWGLTPSAAPDLAPGSGSAAAPGADPVPELAATGTEVLPLALGSALLLLAGAAFLVTSRIRRRTATGTMAG